MTLLFLFTLPFYAVSNALPQPNHTASGVPPALTNPPNATNADILIKPNGRNDTAGAIVILTGFEECEKKAPCSDDEDTTWKDLIISGFKDMQKMIPDVVDDGNTGDIPLVRYEMDWKDASVIEFFGPQFRNQGIREAIQGNMDTLATQTTDWLIGWRLHVRCDDPGNQCSDNESPTIAYTMHGDGKDDHINFCPLYVKQSGLDDAVSVAAAYPSTRDRIDKYLNRATTWAHELMHVSWIGKPVFLQDDHMEDKKYGTLLDQWKMYRSIDTKWIATADRIPFYAAANNPQNYAFLALANYVAKKKGFYPSSAVWDTTKDPPSPFDSTAQNSTAEIAGNLRC